MKSKKLIWALLILIVLIGGFYRIYDLGKADLWFDESISALAAENILEKGIPEFDSGVLYDRAFVFHYLLAFFLIFFKGDFGIRLASVLFGLGSIWLAFLVASEFSWKRDQMGNISEKNYTAGIVAALFTAFIFVEIAYSRQARFYQMFQFMFFLTGFLLYKTLINKEKNWKLWGWLANISLLILADTHLAGLVMLPGFIYVFWKNGGGDFEKNWIFFAIPFLVLVILGQRMLGVGLGTTALSIKYVKSYSSGLLVYLGSLVLISLIGLGFAYRWNKRLFLMLIIPSALLIISVFGLRVFAFRYVYFLILFVPVMLGVLFSFIFRSYKIVFFIILAIALIFPSNLLGKELIVLKPGDIQISTSSEPRIDYKEISDEVREVILSREIVALSTPGVEWYFNKPDHAIPFSLNGLDSGYPIKNEKDIYTNAEVFDYNLNVKYVLIEDEFGYSKLNEAERRVLDEWKSKKKCLLLEEENFVKVYTC